MPTPTIAINQIGKAAGVAGESREDLVLGQVVTATDPANGAGDYNWLFVPPYGSSSEASGLNTDTVTFTPDVAGTFLLYLIYNDQKSYTEDAIDQKITTQGGAAVKFANGNRIPGVGETTQFGTSGWAGALDIKFRNDFRVREEGVLLSADPYNTLDFRAATGTTLSLSDEGSGIAVVTLSGSTGVAVTDEGVTVTGTTFGTLDFVGPGVWVEGDGASEATVTISGVIDHAGDHITGAGDEVDGDQLDIDWDPSNYTPATNPSEVTSADHLTAHLYGIDIALASAGTNIASYDEGVELQTVTESIDFVGAGVAATASGTGIRVTIAGAGVPGAHAATHLLGAGDEIDGDKLDIDWDPSNYTPSTDPGEVTSVDHLTAHLQGIDTQFLAGGTDEKIKISSNDTTASYLGTKLIAGPNIILTEVGDGGNETLQVETTMSGVNIQDEGSGVPNTPHVTLNFVGAGIWAEDGGNGVTTVTVSGGSGGGVGASNEKFINTIRAGDTESNASTSPLIASQFQFDPSEYSLTGATRTVIFRAVAAVNGGSVAAKVQLYNLTDSEYIGSGVTFNSETPAKAEESLTVGAGAGEVDNSAKIYESHIWVTSAGGSDAIELGSAEIRVINTVD